ncbi:glycoside hydrolase family 15 protein [Devosia nitrariae]|uniref:Glucan 1,4-alpha-glucosidase n=1 Tax=Devosia nitrariae TaxID=2071872 RepID=A0ABQ5W980_9HYPH|nr:glycoside hydrolase family 15 protein [Devosia nitrariae]GLQ56191.1 glucan 1,4-alpha-glucosidase [Devosia nitrariae]
MSSEDFDAPGAPGIRPTWASSAKDMVTTALGGSRLWATLGHGILNEVYWPSTGRPQIRDLGFVVAGKAGWHEVKRVQHYRISTPEAFVPLPSVVHQGDGYRLELEFLAHPLRDVLLIRYKLDGEGFKLYTLLAPHLNGEPINSAFAGEDLWARQGETALCLRNNSGLSCTSAGYVGVSDGWQDFDTNGAMTWTYPRAADGNVALTGELAAGSGTLALGFAKTVAGARTLARSSLADDYDDVRSIFIGQWESWGETLTLPYLSPELHRAAGISASVIKIHEDRTFAGAVVASLSVPWGSSHDDPGGYHLVWTRDTVEAALAMIAVGQVDDAARTLAYLIGTQAEDGSWAQNYFPDGTGYWSGRQLDEVALPIILMAKLKALGRLTNSAPVEEMVRKAAGFIVRNGPMSDQDRWEENAGASPFTLAVTVCALVAAADFFEEDERTYILSLADCWNERIEDWTYCPGGTLCAATGVDGYYVRLSPKPADGGIRGAVTVRNVAQGAIAATDLVGMDFLYLVRTGLRSPNDHRILNTVRVVDEMLRVETPSGPSFHRYNGDGYGEHADGSAFDGTGIGRLWPLLTGERGHYAAAAGQQVDPYLEAMVHMSGQGGLMPEQVWDTDAIPRLGLEPGKPSGSAMPLVWAHAEFLKLLATQATGRPAELLDEVERRYRGHPPEARQWHWRKSSPFMQMPAGRHLHFEAAEPFVLHYSLDGWRQTVDQASRETCFGLHAVALTAETLAGCESIAFTFYYPRRDSWEGRDFVVERTPDEAGSTSTGAGVPASIAVPHA